jgi:flagellar basal body-associated protein FliL
MRNYILKTTEYGVIFVTPKLTLNQKQSLRTKCDYIREVLIDSVSDKNASSIVLDLGHWQKVEECKNQIEKYLTTV